jgi:hypothetical protein
VTETTEVPKNENDHDDNGFSQTNHDTKPNTGDVNNKNEELEDIINDAEAGNYILRKDSLIK